MNPMHIPIPRNSSLRDSCHLMIRIQNLILKILYLVTANSIFFPFYLMLIVLICVGYIRCLSSFFCFLPNRKISRGRERRTVIQGSPCHLCLITPRALGHFLFNDLLSTTSHSNYCFLTACHFRSLKIETPLVQTKR